MVRRLSKSNDHGNNNRNTTELVWVDPRVASTNKNVKITGDIQHVSTNLPALINVCKQTTAKGA